MGHGTSLCKNSRITIITIDKIGKILPKFFISAKKKPFILENVPLAFNSIVMSLNFLKSAKQRLLLWQQRPRCNSNRQY